MCVTAAGTATAYWILRVLKTGSSSLLLLNNPINPAGSGTKRLRGEKKDQWERWRAGSPPEKQTDIFIDLVQEITEP